MTGKILVLDDDPEIHTEVRGLLQQPLASGQLVVLAAYDARSALRLLLAEPDIDILMLDIGLPDIDGITLLRELKELQGVFSVVILTGNQDRGVVLEALNYGATGFLYKPLKRHELEAVLERALNNTRKNRSLLQSEVENNFLRLLNERLNREIAEREKIQNELKILSAAVEQSADSIIVTDKDGFIQYVNRGFSQITGYSREEALGKTPRLLKSGKHPPEFYQLLWQRITKGHTFQAEFANRRKNGELYWEDKTITPIYNAQGEIMFFVSTGKDKTEKKRIERLREDTERIMQHDMKNPLNGIIGFAEVLLETHLSPEQRDMVQYIRDAAIELTQMVMNSLDIFKMEEGSYRPEQQHVDLFAVAKATLAMFSYMALQRRVTLTLEPPGSSAIVLGSQRHLQGMCYNLVKNAIEASSSGDVVKLWFERQDSHILLKIWNRQPIPEEIREHFFERYVTYGKPNGHGLGTYSAQLVARVHGGELTFSSNKEDGTTLIARLPLI